VALAARRPLIPVPDRCAAAVTSLRHAKTRFGPHLPSVLPSSSAAAAKDARVRALSRSVPGTVGGVQNGVDLSAEINAAIAASADAPGRTCTINFNSITNATTINATGGGTAPTLNGRTVTLSGVTGDSFIIDVIGKFILNGGSRIVVTGIQPRDVLYNILGSGGQVAVTGGGGGTGCCKSSVDGTLIALHRNIALSLGLVNGELIGGQNISIVSGSSVKCPPSPCVPNPG